MTEYQLAQLLAYGEHIYLQHPQGRPSSGKGVFSDAWLTEFVGMARRDERLRKEHGQKHLANRYERHVALLFQSFGFVTVPALSGEEAADLLCIGKDQSESFTFLVDAKSSKSHYTFPKADQRALANYVRQTTSSLSDLPALKCVLLIGNGPASTVQGKLESETVITSQDLKDLVQKQSDMDRTYSEFVRGMRAITRS